MEPISNTRVRQFLAQKWNPLWAWTLVKMLLLYCKFHDASKSSQKNFCQIQPGLSSPCRPSVKPNLKIGRSPGDEPLIKSWGPKWRQLKMAELAPVTTECIIRLCLPWNHQEEGPQCPQCLLTSHQFPPFCSPIPEEKGKKVARLMKNVPCAVNLVWSCSLDDLSSCTVPWGQVAAHICLLVTFICANNKSYGKGAAGHASHLLTQWIRKPSSPCCPRINECLFKSLRKSLVLPLKLRQGGYMHEGTLTQHAWQKADLCWVLF